MSVYFAQLGESGPIKIGVSKNVQGRIETLQTALPWPLSILKILKGWGRNAEYKIHASFEPHRLKGEWFNPHADIFQFLEKPKLESLPIPASVRKHPKKKNKKPANYRDPVFISVNAFLELTTMSDTAFGIKAVNDTHLIPSLRKGRRLRRATRRKLDNFMRNFKNLGEEEMQHAALIVLGLWTFAALCFGVAMLAVWHASRKQ